MRVQVCKVLKFRTVGINGEKELMQRVALRPVIPLLLIMQSATWLISRSDLVCA